MQIRNDALHFQRITLFYQCSWNKLQNNVLNVCNIMFSLKLDALCIFVSEAMPSSKRRHRYFLLGQLKMCNEALLVAAFVKHLKTTRFILYCRRINITSPTYHDTAKCRALIMSLQAAPATVWSK